MKTLIGIEPASRELRDRLSEAQFDARDEGKIQLSNELAKLAQRQHLLTLELRALLARES